MYISRSNLSSVALEPNSKRSTLIQTNRNKNSNATRVRKQEEKNEIIFYTTKQILWSYVVLGLSSSLSALASASFSKSKVSV